MAHIPDGVLSVPVLAGGAVVTAASLAWSLKRLGEDELPKVAVVTALFFVASLINVAIGPTTVHLMLAGLMGLVIGWAAVPAVFVGLILQSIIFGFGGITTLGVNTMNIALPGVLWALAMGPLLRRARSPFQAAILGSITAALSVTTTALLVALALALSDPAYVTTAKLVILTNPPATATAGEPSVT